MVPSFKLTSVIIRNNTLSFIGDGSITIAGNGGGMSVSENSKLATLTDVTVADNRIVAERYADGYANGAGISSRNNMVTLTRCNITNNQIFATAAMGVSIDSDGGGIFCAVGLILRSSIIAKNAIRVTEGSTANTVRGGGKKVA